MTVDHLMAAYVPSWSVGQVAAWVRHTLRYWDAGFLACVLHFLASLAPARGRYLVASFASERHTILDLATRSSSLRPPEALLPAVRWAQL